MFESKRFLAFSVWCTLLGHGAVLSAAPPWPTNLFQRNKSDASVQTPKNRLEESNGPWMILAAAFAGPGSRDDATRLVHELRKRYKLDAYLHKQHYDFSDSLTGRGFDKHGSPKQMKYERDTEYDEYAVLIGDFPSVDDHRLQETLRRVKYAHPDCLDLSRESNSTLRFAGLRALHKRLTPDEAKQRKGPMGQAFVTRNPLLPHDVGAPGTVDEFVEKINKDVEFCLLDCPRSYSVRVATFRGNVVIDQKKVAEIEDTGEMESRLVQAAERAHRLTRTLRERGIEAYEFHDRFESIVAVGSFDSVGQPRSDGKIEINPTIKRIMDAYGPNRVNGVAGAQTMGLSPKTLGGIPLDVQPTPVAVPRRPNSSKVAVGRKHLR